MIRGRFVDGRTAEVREVEVRPAGDGLRLIGEGVDQTWPNDQIRAVPTPVGEPRILALGVEGVARLTLSPGDAEALRALAPLWLKPQNRWGMTGLGIVALTAIAGLILGVVFVGVPAASEPLARATPLEMERRLGGQTEELVALFADDCAVDDAVQADLDALALALGEALQSPFAIEARLIDADFPNAFALPGGAVLVTDELLAIMQTPEELAGVLAHEAAHVAERHAMASIWRQLGYGLVFDLTVGGGSGAGQQIALAGASLDRLRHSRRAEAQADARALDALQATGIDATGLAQFFERLDAYLKEQAEDDDIQLSYPELLSTHPDTERRAARARQNAGSARGPALSEAAWARMKTACDAPEADEGDEPEASNDGEAASAPSSAGTVEQPQ